MGFSDNIILEFKYMRLLAITYVTFLMAATVMAYKLVDVCGVTAPGSTLIYTCTFFLGNVYAEIYGPIYAKKLVWESIFSGYVFAILVSLINSLPSPDFWNNAEGFNQVFGHIIRFTNAGVIGFLLSAFLNTYLISSWKLKLKGRFFWLRSLVASSLSEGIATFFVGIVTFFWMMPTKNIISVMASALIFKIVYGLFAVWPATFLAYILKKNEIKSANSFYMNNYQITS